jgi:hypothetical protein
MATARKREKTLSRTLAIKRTECCTTTARRLTLHSSVGNFSPKVTWLSFAQTLLFSVFPIEEKMNDRHFDAIEVIEENSRQCWTPSQNTNSRMHFKNIKLWEQWITRRRVLLPFLWWQVSPKLTFWSDDSTSPGNYGRFLFYWSAEFPSL